MNGLNTIREIEKLIKNAGEKMLSSSPIQITQKTNSKDLVTNMDNEIQSYLISEILKLCPDAGFLCEEQFTGKIPNTPYVFVIDPIDGTSNFSCGYNQSVISIACIKENEALFGLIYNPYTKELFLAIKGKGSYLNGTHISVTKKSLSQSLVGFGIAPYNEEFLEPSFEIAKKIAPQCLDLRRIGSAALELCYVACGRTALYYELTLKPWDYAAGKLIVEEAGGIVTNFQKENPIWYQKSSIIAANKKETLMCIS